MLLCLTQTFGELDLKFVMAASSLPKDLLRNPGLKDLVIKGLFVVFFLISISNPYQDKCSEER